VAASRTACCIFLSLCTAGNRFVLTRSDVAVPMRFRFVENATVVRRMSMSGVIDAVQFAVSATESTRLGALRHDTYTAGSTDVPHTTGGAGTIFDWVIRINNQIWPTQQKKGKASSLDIAPLTILNSGTFTTSEVAADWQ